MSEAFDSTLSRVLQQCERLGVQSQPLRMALNDWVRSGAPFEGPAWADLRQACLRLGVQATSASGVETLTGNSPQWCLWQSAPGAWHGASWQGQQLSWDGEDAHPQALKPGTWVLVLSLTGLPEQRGGREGYWQWVSQVLRGRMGSLVVMSLLINMGLLTIPLFTMLVYDKVVHNGIFETLWALGLGVMLFLLVEVLLRSWRTLQVERLSQWLDQRLDARMFSSLLTPASSAGSRPGMTARFVSLYRDLAASRDFFSSHYLLALADLPFVILLWAVIAWIALPLWAMLMAWTALFVVVGLWMKARSRRLTAETSRLQTKKFALLADALSSMDALRTSHLGLVFLHRFAQVSQDHSDFQALMREDVHRFSLWSQVVFAGSYVSLLIVGAYLVFGQQLSQGALIAVAMLSGRTLMAIGQSLMTLGRWQELRESLQAMSPFLGGTDEAVPEAGAHKTGSVQVMRGDIKLLQVGHAYNAQSSVLDSVTLHIKAGEKVALLGRPGSGKSTLARILVHAITPSHGEVRLDDVGLGQCSLPERAKWLSFKPQEAVLVAGTVESNILAALPPDTTEALRAQALKRGIVLSGLDLELSQGTMALNQVVEEYGSNLSGGQRQKVALARALALDVPVVVLDEPSNGLDPESERLLVQRLATLQNVTLVLVSHSARLLALCSRVVALDRGRVVADGPTEQVVRVDAAA